MTLKINEWVGKYEQGNITSKELLGFLFSHHDRETALFALRCHADEEVRRVGARLSILLREES